jgi:hypothetical protein
MNEGMNHQSRQNSVTVVVESVTSGIAIYNGHAGEPAIGETKNESRVIKLF